MIHESLTEWFAIVISLATLAFTIRETISTRRELRRQEERDRQQLEEQEYRTLLDHFLLPLGTTVARSLKGFEYLKHGHEPEIHRLEYYPGRLRMLFESLPDERRVFWRVEIGQLHDHNDHAVRLIDTYASRSRLNVEFQKRCEDFRRHATTWKAMWNAIQDLTVPSSDLPGEQIAEPFPEGFDDAIRDETDRVRREAALEERASPQTDPRLDA